MKENQNICQIQTEAKTENASSTLIACGLGVGALGTGAALLTGTVCPLCLIATQALLGGGIVMKIKENIKRDKL